jgi:hypothetical protein
MMEVECTWGDGPDIVVSLDGKRVILYENAVGRNKFIHGFIENGSFDLTADEAEKLAGELMRAANFTRQIEATFHECVPEKPEDELAEGEQPILKRRNNMLINEEVQPGDHVMYMSPTVYEEGELPLIKMEILKVDSVNLENKTFISIDKKNELTYQLYRVRKIMPTSGQDKSRETGDYKGYDYMHISLEEGQITKETYDKMKEFEAK